MKKTFIMNKKALKRIFPKLNVIQNESPIIVLNDLTLTAKVISFKNIDDLKNNEMINDIICLESYLYLLKINKKIFMMTNNMSSKEITNNINDADKIFMRYYSI